jgi:rhodanese-related sulfurtransferase
MTPIPQTQASTSASTPPPLIPAATLKEWLESESVLLVDVREPVEYANEHIPGAISLPLSKFKPEQVRPEPGQRLVLYCQSGKRSAQVSQKLMAAGVAGVSELQDGITAWQTQSYPLVKSKNAPISLFRQVQIVAGSLVLLGTIVGVTVSPWGFILSGFVGGGLLFAGLTNTCAMAMLLAKLPYNQRFGQRWQ